MFGKHTMLIDETINVSQTKPIVSENTTVAESVEGQSGHSTLPFVWRPDSCWGMKS